MRKPYKKPMATRNRPTLSGARRADSGGPLAFFGLVFVILAVILAVIYGARGILDTPDVRVSYPSEECVEVVDHAASHAGVESPWSCDNLPKTYNRIWVH